MTKCQACRKFLLFSSQGVTVVQGRPNDTAASLMLSAEERLAVSTLQGLSTTAIDVKADVVVCKPCWSAKLEPPQIAQVDERLAAISSGGSQKKKADLGAMGNLTGQYYASGLAKILEASKDRDVLGWALYASNQSQNYSKELDQVFRNTVVPKVRTLTSHADQDVAQAARFVVKAFEGTLEYGAWDTFAPSWNGFRKRG